MIGYLHESIRAWSSKATSLPVTFTIARAILDGIDNRLVAFDYVTHILLLKNKYRAEALYLLTL
jgi:hypothetical protein